MKYYRHETDEKSPSFTIAIGIVRDPLNENEFCFQYGEKIFAKDQTLKKENNQSRPFEIKKIMPNGSSKHPDVKEFMEDFSPDAPRKHVFLLVKPKIVQSSKSASPTLGQKLLKMTYSVQPNEESVDLI